MKERKSVRKTVLLFDMNTGGVFSGSLKNVSGSVLFCVINNNGQRALHAALIFDNMESHALSLTEDNGGFFACPKVSTERKAA